jgi:predicted secreted protein
MTLSFAIAIYVIIWWIVLFAMLPIGVRTQEEEGEVSPGTAESAPHMPKLLPKMLATTVVASVVFAVVYVIIVHRVITLDQIPFLPRYEPVREPLAQAACAQQKKQGRETLLFLSSQYSLSHPPKRGSPSILTIECVLADERLRLLTRIQRAWSYFLPRLGPGPISTRDSEIILPVPNSHHVVPGTLARPRQIVTMIVIRWHKFMPPTPFLLGRSPQN